MTLKVENSNISIIIMKCFNMCYVHRILARQVSSFLLVEISISTGIGGRGDICCFPYKDLSRYSLEVIGSSSWSTSCKNKSLITQNKKEKLEKYLE